MRWVRGGSGPDQVCCTEPVCVVVAPTTFPEEMNASNVTHQDLVDLATAVAGAAAAEAATEAAGEVDIVVVVIVQTADETAMMTAQTADVITTVDEVAVTTTAKTTDMRDVIVLIRRPIALLNSTLPANQKKRERETEIKCHLHASIPVSN